MTLHNTLHTFLILPEWHNTLHYTLLLPSTWHNTVHYILLLPSAWHYTLLPTWHYASYLHGTRHFLRAHRDGTKGHAFRPRVSRRATPPAAIQSTYNQPRAGGRRGRGEKRRTQFIVVGRLRPLFVEAGQVRHWPVGSAKHGAGLLLERGRDEIARAAIGPAGRGESVEKLKVRRGEEVSMG